MSAVAKILNADAETYTRKAADYAPGSDPWENFTAASNFAERVCRGLRIDDPRRATATLIGIKISRLMTLGLTGHAHNEAFEDTLRDLRVYVAILEAQNAEETAHHLGAFKAVELEIDAAFENLVTRCVQTNCAGDCEPCRTGR